MDSTIATSDYVELRFDVEQPSGPAHKACIVVYKRSDATMEISLSGLRLCSITGAKTLIDRLKQACDIAVVMRDKDE